MSVKMQFTTDDVKVQSDVESVAAVKARLEGYKHQHATRQLSIENLEQKLQRAAERRQEKHSFFKLLKKERVAVKKA